MKTWWLFSLGFSCPKQGERRRFVTEKRAFEKICVRDSTNRSCGCILVDVHNIKISKITQDIVLLDNYAREIEILML